MTVGEAITHSRGVKAFRFNTDKTEYEAREAMRSAWELGIIDDEVASLNFGTGDSSQCPSTQKTVPGAYIVCEISTVYEEVEECGN